VGDSVTIDISVDLQHDMPGAVVDGRVGRQFGEGIQIVDGLRRAGRLPPVVIVALGTNGTVTAAQVDAMLRAAAGARRVVLVTVHVPRSWQDADNATLRAGAARDPRAVIADWYALSAGHPEWFAPDGYHLNRSGSRALAALIVSVV
jgi:lysophospholipase L1-like esterase